MNEIIAAIVGALLAGPAGFLLERFLSRPRIAVSYAKIGYEDVIALSQESQELLARHVSFMEWMDTQVPWKFKQSAQGNYFSSDEIRILYDLGTHYLGLQEALGDKMKGIIAKLEGTAEEIARVLPEYMLDYHNVFGKQLAQDYAEDPVATVERLKAHYVALADNMSNLAIPLLRSLLTECQQHLTNGRGTSDRLTVRVGIGNRGVQDGLIEAEAALQAIGRSFRLPVKLTRRPWHTEDEEGGSPDSSYIRLIAKSFKVLDFVIDDKLNARVDLEELIKELRSGTPTTFVAHGLGRREIASLQFKARLP